MHSKVDQGSTAGQRLEGTRFPVFGYRYLFSNTPSGFVIIEHMMFERTEGHLFTATTHVNQLMEFFQSLIFTTFSLTFDNVEKICFLPSDDFLL